MGEASSGFFGKVPARGDFLSRRVPPALAPAWETWLQALTLAVKDSGERGWQDAWLTAPLWHFVLGRNLAPPSGAAGVMIASADRVGRLFPFTLIGSAAANAPQDPYAWAHEAETLAISALADDFDPAAFEAALAQLGPPPPPRGPALPTGTFELTLNDDWPASSDPLGSGGAEDGAGPDQSQWWTRGSERLTPTRLRCTGLPSAPVSRAMILGGF